MNARWVYTSARTRARGHRFAPISSPTGSGARGYADFFCTLPSLRETAGGGGIPRALALLQNRPRTSPELQLSPNEISPSHKTSHLTPRPFPNSPACTPATQRTATRRAVAQHGCTGHLGLALACRSGRPSTTVQLPTPSSNAGRWDALERAAATRSGPRQWRTRSSELGLLRT